MDEQQEEAIRRMTRAALARLIDAALSEHMESIEAITQSGEIALLAYEPNARWRRALGIPAGAVTSVGQMRPDARRRFIATADSVTARWASGSRTGRVFAVIHSGSVLLNIADGDWSIEPGSLDGDAS